MKKRLIVTLLLVLMCLCLQTALAQQPSPAPVQRVPQLTTDDLESSPTSAPAASSAPAAEAAPATRDAAAAKNAPRSWARHSYPDLGLSMEFSGNPPTPKAFQFQLPENPIADRNAQAQVFDGGEWSLSIMRLSLSMSPPREALRDLAAGFAESIGVINPQYLPESGPNPTVLINGTINRQNETRNFKGRLTTQGKQLWFITSDCRPANPQGCADARHILDSTIPTP